MGYRVVVTEDAEADFDRYVRYLLFEKKNEQAAKNLLDDFELTMDKLKEAAGSLKLCDNLELRKLGYRRINFLYHHYFMLYRVEGEKVIIDMIFHDQQDYENRIN